jgi:glycosyltransferase involved in cell wall biosynthesis
MDIPTVSITIPCRNEQTYIGKCLDSLVKLNYSKEKLLVFVVDGKSDDSTVEIVQEYSENYPWIKLLENNKMYTPFALNIGLQASDASIKIILGAHSELDANYVRNCVEVLQKKIDVGCVGGVIRNIYENYSSEVIGLAMSSAFGVGDATFRTGGADGYVDTVAFGAYRNEVFEKIGYFDEDLVRNQDDEFNFRLIRNGYKIFLNNDIMSNYFVRGNYSKLYRQYYQYGYWKVFVNIKHRTVTTWRQLIPALFVMFLFFTPLLFILSEKVTGLYLFGILSYLCTAAYFSLKKTKVFSVFLSVIMVFFTLHLSYGCGYLMGIGRFLILKRKPSSRSTVTSR